MRRCHRKRGFVGIPSGPEVVAATVWLTGLSGAGKTTIGRALVEALQRDGRPAVLLDGDEIRQHISRDLGFSREDRDEQVRRVGWLCELLNRHGVIAVAAVVSPYADTRAEVRSRIGTSSRCTSRHRLRCFEVAIPEACIGSPPGTAEGPHGH